MMGDRFNCVLRTRRLKPTDRGIERRNKRPIGSNQPDQHYFHMLMAIVSDVLREKVLVVFDDRLFLTGYWSVSGHGSVVAL
jgi:hypothetical protein